MAEIDQNQISCPSNENFSIHELERVNHVNSDEIVERTALRDDNDTAGGEKLPNLIPESVNSASEEKGNSNSLQTNNIMETKEKNDCFIIPYICGGACNYISVSEDLLNVHLKTMHSKDKQLKCSICQVEFENYCDLSEHINVDHVNSNKIIFKCQMENCNKLLYRLPDLKNHFSTEHQNSSLLQCTFCYKQKPLDRLLMHIQHHLKNTFKCSYCNSSFDKKDDLFEHIRLSHTGMPKRMNLLVEIINYERYLSQINVNPEGDILSKDIRNDNTCFIIKPSNNILKFQCSKCTYTSNTEKSLNIHMNSCHSNILSVGDYSCSLCRYVTDDKDSFKEHISHHKNVLHNIRIYACSYCKKQSTSMDIIEQHVSGHHPFNSFKFKAYQESISYLSGLVECSICNDAFLWKDKFCYHLSLEHNLENLANYLLIQFNQETVSEHIIIPKSSYDNNIKPNECLIDNDNNLVNKKLKEIGSYIPKLTNKMLFSCKLCPFQCSKTMNFKRHSAIHEKAQLLNDCYKCAYCQFKHNKFSCIKFHLNKYHNELPLKIVKVSNGEEMEVSLMENTASSNSMLQKLYNEPDQLNRSSLTEFVDSFLPRGMIFANPVKCPYCDFTNKIRVNFVRHMKFHINEKVPSDTDTEDDICHYVMHLDKSLLELYSSTNASK